MSGGSARARSTLHDVAAHAGVSIATASRALNGLVVSPQSLQRVRKAATELGYVANDAARALRSDRSMALGLIFFELSGWKGLELLDALSAQLDLAGYSLLISTARGDPAAYDLHMRRFLERRVDGLFCVAPPDGLESPASFRAARAPLMTLIRRSAAFAGDPLIKPSVAAAITESNARLQADGHRKIVLIKSIERPSAMLQPRLDTVPTPFEVEVVPQPAPGAMIDLLKALMARPDRPTLLAAAEVQANQAFAAALALGLRIPEDLSIVAICNASDPRHADAPLSSLMLDPGVLGRAAAGAMIGWLNGEPPSEEVSIETAYWVWRASTGPASAGNGRVS